MSRSRVIPVYLDPVLLGVRNPEGGSNEKVQAALWLAAAGHLPTVDECLWSGARVWRQFAITYTGATKQFEYDDTTQVGTL